VWWLRKSPIGVHELNYSNELRVLNLQLSVHFAI
jgi:hypothetical protein